MSTISLAQSMAGADFGGAENFYTRLVCALGKYPTLRQHAFTRMVPDRVAQIEAAGISASTFRFGGRLDFRDHYRYRKALAQLAPDIVMTFMTRATQLTPAGDYRLIARLGHYYNLKHYRHCSHWIGISKGICDHLIQGGMPAERVFHIGNFADETIHGAIPRTSYETPEDVPLIVAAGRLHKNKAFDILLPAIANIPDVHLWLAGDGPERQALVDQAQQLNIAHRVKFLGWQATIAPLLRTADLFVCPSRHEGLGSIVMESWFNEIPIIATRSQGPGEAIEDGVTGLLTGIDDVNGLHDAIKTLLADAPQRDALSTAAKQHYDEQCSEAAICSQYLSLYQELMATPLPENYLKRRS